MKFALILLFAASCFGQSALPDRGTLADIQGRTKVYVIADAEHFASVEKAISKKLVIVNSAADAEFFLEYQTLSTKTVGPSGMSLETGQLEAYFNREKQKVIAWSASKTGGAFNGDTSMRLTKQFIKDLTKPLPH